MNHTKKFIEDAIEEGWEGTDEYGGEYTMRDYLQSVEKILLDPSAWKAVGKVRGWGLNEDGEWVGRVWENMWFHFIGSLADNKSIEEALEAISK